MNIELTPHSGNWKKAFEDEREILLDIFQDDIKAIEHIGSTSIPDLDAKPVIDVFIAVSPFRSIPFYKGKLDFNYYRSIKTDMINRYLFSKYSDKNTWTHNLHILPFDEDFYSRNEILFRDYLRKKPEWVSQYNQLKQQLVLKYTHSLEDYTQAKTQFIQTVVDLARAEKGLPRQDVWTMVYIKDD